MSLRPPTTQFWLMPFFMSLVALNGAIGAEDVIGELRERLQDEHAFGADLWVYNDIAQARELARQQNKPIFVTFRCVPCQACLGFDAEVVKGSQRIRRLATERFVPVRQVEMKGVDLTQFQFDYDLNWAAMFMNADGTMTRDMFWKYPLPENVGLIIDAKDGILIESVRPDSPASRAHLKAGESIRYANGQAITSIADIKLVE